MNSDDDDYNQYEDQNYDNEDDSYQKHKTPKIAIKQFKENKFKYKIQKQYQMDDYDRNFDRHSFNSQWSITDDVLLLKHVQQLGLCKWEVVQKMLKKKDQRECMSRFKHLRGTKKYEDSDPEIDTNWDKYKENILFFSNLLFKGDIKRINKIFPEFKEDIIKDKINNCTQQLQSLNNNENNNNLLENMYKDYRIISLLLSNQSIVQVSKQLKITENECKQRVKDIINNQQIKKELKTEQQELQGLTKLFEINEN